MCKKEGSTEEESMLEYQWTANRGTWLLPKLTDATAQHLISNSLTKPCMCSGILWCNNGQLLDDLYFHKYYYSFFWGFKEVELI